MERERRGINIVAIKLDGKAATLFAIKGGIPAAANSVAALGDEMNQEGILGGNRGNFLGGAVGAVIVNDDDIVLEISNLRER